MKRTRPRSATVVGILWMLGGGAQALSSLLGASQMLTAASDPELYPVGGGTPLYVLVGASLAIATLATYGAACGYGLLKLKRWAHKGLKVLTTLALVGIALFYIAMLVMSGFASRGAASDSGMMFLISTIVCAASAAPFVLMLKHLRSPELSLAVMEQGEADTETVAETFS